MDEKALQDAYDAWRKLPRRAGWIAAHSFWVTEGAIAIGLASYFLKYLSNRWTLYPRMTTLDTIFSTAAPIGIAVGVVALLCGIGAVVVCRLVWRRPFPPVLNEFVNPQK